MKCLQATKAISDARERELHWSEKVGMRTHLLYCPHCRAFKVKCENLSRLMQTFKQAPKTHEK